jgi:hypothetical protein
VTWLLFPLLCGAAYYLLAHADITRPVWSRYPAWLDRFTACSACLGFWLGCACAAVGWQVDVALPPLAPHHWSTIPITGLCAIIWTPLVAYLQLSCLSALMPAQEGEATATHAQE